MPLLKYLQTILDGKKRPGQIWSVYFSLVSPVCRKSFTWSSLGQSVYSKIPYLLQPKSVSIRHCLIKGYICSKAWSTLVCLLQFCFTSVWEKFHMAISCPISLQLKFIQLNFCPNLAVVRGECFYSAIKILCQPLRVWLEDVLLHDKGPWVYSCDIYSSDQKKKGIKKETQE